jgi:hypothetical protein
VIQDAITPYAQMIMSPMKRDLLIVIIAVASGLMLLFFASCAQAEPRTDLKLSDTSHVTSVEDAHASPHHATLKGESHDLCR